MNDGGHAFPIQAFRYQDGDVDPAQPGMSLRDWFAGQALQALLASGAVRHITGDEASGGLGQSNDDAERFVAAVSYRFADAMLAERQKERPA